MKKVTNCSNCPFNGQRNDACLSCAILSAEEYSYQYRHYILPTYDAPEPEPEERTPVTDLDEQVEDAMRKLVFTIFDLDNTELLLLKAIMNQKSLTEFARDFNAFIDYNNKKKTKRMSRFCAFQIRKRMQGKLGKLALLTNGQKKQLKGEDR